MAEYLKSVVSAQKTPQSEPLFGKTQVKNNAGGYVFEIDDMQRLERFLVLGSEGGTYYVGERKLTLDNVNVLKRLLASGEGIRVVDTIVEFSVEGRIPRNSTALFSLAVAMSLGDVETRRYAASALPKIARTASHLLEFVSYLDTMRSWGRGIRRAIKNWYMGKDVANAAFTTTKYRNRSGWTHRDVLRSAHTKPTTEFEPLFKYLVKGEVEENVPDIVKVFEQAKTADADELVKLIREKSLTWEMVPSEMLGEAKVWDALSEDMPITALYRNLATLTRVGVLAPLTTKATAIAERLTDQALLNRGRVHPVQVLSALATYQSGHGARGQGTWTPVPQIVDALEKSFDLSFKTVEPTGKKVYIGLDVSSSMTWNNIVGIPNLTACMGATTLALVTARTEPNYYIAGFSSESVYDSDTGMKDLGITAQDSLTSAMEKGRKANFGSTDCSLPMLDALKKNMDVDCFVILTDNETWSGSVHPTEALRKYRNAKNKNAKLVVIGMASTGFSIADPDDPFTLDVAGFDANVPRILAEFIR